ncbi:hypothetical protein GCM10023235_17930 [Kitasatospora terrestris]|uniref:Lipopolysaccharide assembly protein A domain-containing protein n=1 Tax=Kitasatospora terrestris TaxID=258051 RepID=A0ABP9DEC8_9ACTN
MNGLAPLGRVPGGAPVRAGGRAQTAAVTKTSGGSSGPQQRGEIAGVPTRYIAIAVIVVLAVWFLFANLERVQIQFWVFTVTCPLWIALLATLLAGTALGWLLKGRQQR